MNRSVGFFFPKSLDVAKDNKKIFFSFFLRLVILGRINKAQIFLNKKIKCPHFKTLFIGERILKGLIVVLIILFALLRVSTT